MDWNGVEYAAKVLVVGDEATVKRAEKDLLKSIDSSSEADEENRPPKKKMHLTKEKKAGGKARQKQQKGKKKGKKTQCKMKDFELDLGSPPKQPKTQTDGRLCIRSHPSIQALPLNPPPAHPAPSREPDCSRSVSSDLSFSSSSSSEDNDVVLTGTFPRKVC